MRVVQFWAAGFAFLAAATAACGAGPARPNILFIFIDDMGYADPGCFGGGAGAETPNMDRLAAEGLRFTQFYVNAPICSPSRVAVTTGQYPGRWQITSYLDTRRLNRRRGVADWLRPTAPSLARILAGAGYYTAHVGKWHMGGQRDVGAAPPISAYGFATSLTNFAGPGERVLPLFEPRPDGKPFEHGPTQMSARLPGGPIHWVKRHEVTAFYVDRALQEIKTAIARGRPFYINLWPDDVHSPLQAPPGLRGNGSPRDNYQGVLKELDRQLGRVFDFIRSEPELRRNTIILLASDNGPESGLGSAGELRGGKGMLYEGGVRVPYVFRWPGRVPPGTVCHEPINSVDLYPTLLDLAGAKPQPGYPLDGTSYLGCLTGGGRTKLAREALYWHFPGYLGAGKNSWRTTPAGAVRCGQYKLLEFFEDGRLELYDLEADIGEQRNLAAEKPDLAKQLHGKLVAWRESIAAPMPRRKSAEEGSPSAPPATKKRGRNRR